MDKVLVGVWATRPPAKVPTSIHNAETQGLFGGPSDPLDIFIDIVFCAYYYVVLRSPPCFFKGHYRK